MNIQFERQGSLANLPKKTIFPRWIEWFWQLHEWNNKHLELLSSNRPPMVTWGMEGTHVNENIGRFQFMSPEDFWKNPVIILPPQWISLKPWNEGKGYVIQVQNILNSTISSNTSIVCSPCLAAMVSIEKARQWIGKALTGAWYQEIWQSKGHLVYVHEITIGASNEVRYLLDMEA